MCNTEEIIKELNKKIKIETELVIKESCTEKLYYSADELIDMAKEQLYLDTKIETFEDVIFYLENGIWRDEIQ